MNFCCYLFIIFNLILFTNLVKSRLRHIKVTHKNGVKTYVVNRQRFGTFKDAYKYSKIKSNTLKKARPLRRLVKRTIKNPILGLTKKPMKKITKLSISRRNNKNAREKTIGIIEPVVITPKPLVTVSPIISTSKPTTKVSTSTTTSENSTETTNSTIKSTVTTTTSTESPTTTTTTATTTTSTDSPTTTTTTATTSTSTQTQTTTTTTVKANVDSQRLARFYNGINNYRRKYKIPPLNIDKTLQLNAELCVSYFERDNIRWESDDPEVAFTFGSNAWNPDGAVDYWESTKKNYNYDSPVCNPNNREFVIMVWKSATDIGCGLGPRYNYRICCVFYPMGNLDDEKTLRDNVLRP